MKRLIIILTLFSLGSCNCNKTDNRLTKLEEFVNGSDSLTNNSKLFDQIAITILKERPEFTPSDLKYYKNDSTGKLKEQDYKFYYDTTGNFPTLSFDLKITEYNSNKHAAKAFWEVVEFQACCIPDEDIVKLKNFENLYDFKNGASTTMLSGNILFEMELGENTKSNKEISSLLDKVLSNNKFLKLEIGFCGPAIWTIK
jgi:hypothetical protein